jgi:hypothetical protein
MSDGVALIVSATGCTYIVVFIVIYCFPYSMPVSAQSMNYTCLTTGGLTLFVAAWWLWKSKRGYVGPKGLLESSPIAMSEPSADRK